MILFLLLFRKKGRRTIRLISVLSIINAMICEMCGNESPATRPMMVEGTRLMLCPNCAKFGDEYKASSKSSGGVAAPSRAVIEQRLDRREKRMQTRDVYSLSGTLELVSDYGSIVREAREKKGLDIEQFSASIFEKKGTIAKVEANDLIPNDKLRAKIEKALDIKLTEMVGSSASVGGGSNKGSMTLSNFIKKE